PLLASHSFFAEAAGSCLPDAGAPREHGKAMLGTRVTFPSRGKSPKARQGRQPFGIPPMQNLRPLWCCAALAPGLLSATKQDRFATLGLWTNRSCFSFSSIEGTLSTFNPWRGRWVWLLRAAWSGTPFLGGAATP